MAKIRIDINTTVRNGRALTFKAPADCADITGLIVYYPDGDNITSKDFVFVDSHGVDVGSGTISLFAKNAIVKVVLDVDHGKAYVQNADTNSYLEGKFEDKADKAGGTIIPVSANKTLVESDAGKFLRVDEAATISIPALSVGFEVEVFRNTPGDVRIAAIGVSFAIPGNAGLVTDTQTISDQYSSVVLKQIADKVWSVQGAI